MLRKSKIVWLITKDGIPVREPCSSHLWILELKKDAVYDLKFMLDYPTLFNFPNGKVPESYLGCKVTPFVARDK